jgi:hypothetical protein
VILTAFLALLAVPSFVFAADPVTAPATGAEPAPATADRPAAPVPTAPDLLSLTEIESRLGKQGIRVKEMEVHDKVLEVEGYSAEGRKLELIVDRRNGEILSRRHDD